MKAKDMPNTPNTPSESRQGRDSTLEHLNALVGTWDTEATHPLLPHTTVSGQSTFEWLTGGQFLIWRAHHDHPDIPDSTAILGFDDATDPEAVGTSNGACALHYFDARGVHRVYRTEADAGAWRMWRVWPGFSQRITGKFSDDGDTISCNGELSEDDATWKPDLSVTYRRGRAS